MVCETTNGFYVSNDVSRDHNEDLSDGRLYKQPPTISGHACTPLCCVPPHTGGAVSVILKPVSRQTQTFRLQPMRIRIFPSECQAPTVLCRPFQFQEYFEYFEYRFRDPRIRIFSLGRPATRNTVAVCPAHDARIRIFRRGGLASSGIAAAPHPQRIIPEC